VHDTTWLEFNGIPSVFIASDEFEEAAEAQAESLGLPEVRRLFVPHPIQDANDDEMREKADAIVDDVIAALID